MDLMCCVMDVLLTFLELRLFQMIQQQQGGGMQMPDAGVHDGNNQVKN
jgi:hypothetical protein